MNQNPLLGVQDVDTPKNDAVGGERKGPVSFAALRELATKGELKRVAKVWCRGMKEWQSADSIPKLFDDLPPDFKAEDTSASEPPPLPQAEAHTLTPQASPPASHAVESRLGLNSRTLTLSGILAFLAIGVGGYYVNKAIAHARWVSEAPQREARVAELNDEMQATQRSRGKTAGEKFAQAGAVTGLLRITTRRELEQLAVNVWERPSDHDFTRIVGDGQYIYQIRATGGYYDAPECKEAFLEGFVNGYLDYRR